MPAINLKKTELPTKLRCYHAHHVELYKSSGSSHLAGDCPFCDRDEKFFVEKDTGRFKCHVCGEEGNETTFLTKLNAQYEEALTNELRRKLARDRKMPPAMFRNVGVGYDETSGAYTFPQKNDKGNVRNIGRWSGDGGIRATWGCSKQLLGVQELSKARRGSEVWVCAGEWDVYALRWLFKTHGHKAVVVGVPGEQTFKPEWIPLFDGHKVILAYDADAAGDKGSLKAAEALRSGASHSIRYLAWPMDAPKGFDISDWISHGWLEHRDSLDEVYANLQLLVQVEHRLGPNARKAVGIAKPEEMQEDDEERPDHVPDWDELLAAYRKHLSMDQDMEWCLTVCLATIISIDLIKDPIWFHIIAPPGGGKTTILNQLRNSVRCVFRSSLTAASLLSGFQTSKDPSLLPLLRDKCGVFKDGTELLCMHPQQRSEAFATLRGAFDGDIDRSWGNAVSRMYRDLHFTLLIGVTPLIHGVSEASLGERFLRFQMSKRDTEGEEEQIRAAMDQVGKEKMIDDELRKLTADFLWRRLDLDDLPEVPEDYVDRIIGLARLVGMLRATVETDGWGDQRTLRYRPSIEVGTRLAKALKKLAICVAFVWGKTEVDEEVWRLVERVAFDTAVGFHLDILQSVVEAERPMSVAEVATETLLNNITVRQRIDDMVALKILEPVGPSSGAVGRPARAYVVTADARKLWDRCRIVGDYRAYTSSFPIARRPPETRGADDHPPLPDSLKPLRLKRRKRSKSTSQKRSRA